MRMHVEQLEKDKRELAERMRVIGKWLDHVERAYRKEERPLLAKDYEAQQENDRLTFEALQKARIESSRQQHQLNLETKVRLSRMLDDFKKTKNEIYERRGQEYAEKQREASEKLHEAKVKRTAAVRKAREEERLLKEAEEQKRREQEEEEARREAGAFLYLPLYLTWIVTLRSQSALRRRNGYAWREKQRKRQKKPRGRRRKRSVQLSPNNGARNVKSWTKKLPCNGNAKKKLKGGERNVAPPPRASHRRLPPHPGEGQHHKALLLRLLHVPKALLLLQLSTDLVRSVLHELNSNRHNSPKEPLPLPLPRPKIRGQGGVR